MKRTFVLTILFFGYLSSLSYGESAKNTFKALKRIEAKCQIGISYRDYGSALGDAKYEVNMFLESEEGKAKPALTQAFGKVMNHYQLAGEFWRLKASEGRDFAIVFMNSPTDTFRSPRNQELLMRILNLYPDAKKNIKIGGALEEDAFGTGLIFIDKLIEFIWKEASKELKQISGMLQK